jgi:predicted transcriptional regulator
MLQSDIRRERRAGFLVSKNRDRVSIVAAILEIAEQGARKTKIMFRGNLSYALLNKYLDLVIGAGFIRVEDSIYQLTERGREFVRQYQSFEERYVKAQIVLEALSCEHQQLNQSCKGI